MKQRVNLYVTDLQPTVIRASLQRVMSSFVLVGVLLLLATGYLMLQTKGLSEQLAAQQQTMAAKTTELTNLQQALTQRQPDAALQQKLANLQQSNARKESLLNYLQQDLSTKTQGYAEVMAALAALDPTGLWLTHFSLGAEGNRFEGVTANPVLVPLWLKSLGQVPALQGQQFSEVAVTPTQRKGYLQFSVTSGEQSSVNKDAQP